MVSGFFLNNYQFSSSNKLYLNLKGRYRGGNEVKGAPSRLAASKSSDHQRYAVEAKPTQSRRTQGKNETFFFSGTGQPERVGNTPNLSNAPCKKLGRLGDDPAA